MNYVAQTEPNSAIPSVEVTPDSSAFHGTTVIAPEHLGCHRIGPFVSDGGADGRRAPGVCPAFLIMRLCKAQLNASC